VEARITPYTRAILAVHMIGNPCDLDRLGTIAKKHKLMVIEDTAQACGASYKGEYLGTIGHMGCYSLMSGKHSTAGGQGGMVVTNDENLYWEAKRFADRAKPFNSDAPGNMFLGINYRMTELAAAVGRVQLEKLPRIVEVRRQAAKVIEETLHDWGTEAVKMGKIIEGAKSSYWFVFLRFYPEQVKVSKAEFAAAVAAEGVPLHAGYGALAMNNPYIQDRVTYGKTPCPWCCPYWGGEIDYSLKNYPGAVAADENLMITSVHESYTDEDAADIARAIAKVEKAYRK
jgi:dTDP-4-amino-4,6-dideoxygalactose transaminase